MKLCQLLLDMSSYVNELKDSVDYINDMIPDTNILNDKIARVSPE